MKASNLKLIHTQVIDLEIFDLKGFERAAASGPAQCESCKPKACC
jgi:hypothetical protein